MLLQTRAAVTAAGVAPPSNVQIAISNFGGNSPDLTKGFAGRGVSFIEMNSAPAVPPAPHRTYINQKTIPAMARSTDSGAAAYNGRRGTMAAVAEGGRFIAQSLNDFSLKHAMDRELKRLSADIAKAIAAGGAAVVVVNVHASSPPGNVGMVVARTVNSAFVLTCPNGNPQQAIHAWVRQPKFEEVLPPNVQLETRFLIIAPKAP